MYLAKTTCQSRTGAVRSISRVPLLRSSAKRPHGQERRDEKEDEPKGPVPDHDFHGIRNAARPDFGQLFERQVKEMPGDGEKDGEHDVRDRRIKVRTELSANQAESRTHGLSPVLPT